MSYSFESDYLVIGTGIAGLSFALKAAEVGSVIVITKKESQESNTNYAQGGIASVLSPEASFALHAKDTLDAGAGLCRKDVVDLVVEAGPRMVQELVDWGVRFTREAKRDGPLALGREGGHSVKRIAYSADLTGREIERALTEAVAAHPNIQQFEYHAAVDLITEHHIVGSDATSDGVIHCYGCYALDARSAEVVQFVARATILCSGGAGQIYEHSTNPKIATGDGIAMAYRAGASVGNFEFVQFHPTTLYIPGADSFLISETVRGHGGVLVNKAGEHFMEGIHPLSSLAPRDIVARAIDSEMKKSGEPCVFLDITHTAADEIRERFPNIYNRCLVFGIDITTDLIPVVPAAHYACGGVFTDTWGRTDIKGLFASGEV
ncbi:MAG: FAD-binding protein, partial [Candidatus Latescibacterota bacterium]|nr:FAD-binding protein [Candidatus Latescibacterota bacterium]